MKNKIQYYNGFVNNYRRIHSRSIQKNEPHMGGAMSKAGILREVNIKEGLPTVDEAIRKITYNIKSAGPLGVSAIKLIHGYGSSGKGGGIRTESRKYLDRIKTRGQIKGYITGENFSIFDEETRKAFSVCDNLRRDSDLDRHNNGITIVLL